MLKRILLLTGILALIVNMNAMAFGSNNRSGNFMLPPKDYEKEWKKADSLIEKSLPQSALEVVEYIYNDSKTKGITAQFVKAVIYKLKLRAVLEEDIASSL